MHRRRFAEDGFTILGDPLNAETCLQTCDRLRTEGDPGSRNLLHASWCKNLAGELHERADVRDLVPQSHIPVQCTYFEKSASTNWLVAVHQDLSIPVQHRVEHPGLTGWSQKEGVWYVQPPIQVLHGLVALRVHLDTCGESDGPLRVVPGSHRLGRLSTASAIEARKTLGETICVVQQGALLVMRPLLLHASSKASGQSRRRVLHVLFGPPLLPYGLQWSHAA
ncbi:phytanoyl-CoA dioxygenase family protein [Xanthomonas sp. A2111]|uniref:phytanoyl-CoA dioxygenase family protein n=1 Tax=Xanthomonas hawaiiensis TaxID=3003247 RepID=UPI001ADCA21A|nr:phytanoyl-CoA dioxygenase family protein [Xanthomonas sp. A2111]